MSKWLSTSPLPARGGHGLRRAALCLLLGMLVLLLGAGVALLWDYQQGSASGRAAGDPSIVGPPTVAAATVDAVFARLGSPMAGTGKIVEQASRKANIDDAFALGVWWTETNDGAAGVGLADRNPGSVRGSVGYPSAFDGYTIYPSYTAAIQYWFNMLRNYYVDRGLSSVYVIARPYVGTTSYPLWAAKVIRLMYSYRGLGPPPRVVKPRPRPSTATARRQIDRTWQQTLQGLSREPPRAAVAVAVAVAPSIKVRLGGASALPHTGELAIVLLGLLVALAIALYGLLGVGQKKRAALVPAPGAPARPAPTTEALVVSAQGLSDVAQLDFPELERQTEGLVLARRIILLPVMPADDPERAQLALPRPLGLLSRFAESSATSL